MAGEYAATLAAGLNVARLNVTTATGTGDDPSIPHPAFERMKPRRELCRDLMSGTEAIRAGGTKYLPQYSHESDAAYAVRSVLAALHPAFEETVRVSVGILMQQEPTLGTDMPSPLLQFWEDVDGAGKHGVVFANELVTDGIIDGVSGIFTDYTRADDPTLDRSRASAAASDIGAPLDGADAEAIGLRAYWILVKAEDVIRTYYATVNGVRTLVLFIRRETVEERDGLYGTKTVERFRVYANASSVITCRVYEKRDGQAQPVLTEGPIVIENQTTIPWSPLRAGQQLSEQETNPALMGLAYLVLEHHMIKTGRLSLASLAFTPTIVRVGAPSSYVNEAGVTVNEYPPIMVGPSHTIEVPHTEGTTAIPTPVYYLSPDVSVLQPAKDLLEATETQMALAGRGFLAPDKRAAETAKAKQIAQRAANATLSSVGRALQDCLELSFQHVAAFNNLPTSGSVTVNMDFEDALMEPSAMIAYAKLVELGFPKRLALEALQVGGRISPDADLDEIELEWEAALVAKQQTEADAKAEREAEFAASTNDTRQAA